MYSDLIARSQQKSAAREARESEVDAAVRDRLARWRAFAARCRAEGRDPVWSRHLDRVASSQCSVPLRGAVWLAFWALVSSRLKQALAAREREQ